MPLVNIIIGLLNFLLFDRKIDPAIKFYLLASNLLFVQGKYVAQSRERERDFLFAAWGS